MNGERRNTIEALTGEPLDVLIVGGGIVGAGIARDAAMRRLRVGLVEQHDFAFGASSRSSRLLHGGLRYLAQGRLGQVRDASLEKRVIHHIAPHLAKPMAFVFPTYRASPWAPWALWKLRVGVRLYDLLCSGRDFGRSGSFNAQRLREYLPGINARNLTGAVRYFDGFTNDARLVMDTLRSAARSGALLVNYCRMEDAAPENDRWRCRVKDNLTGAQCDATARSVVNAAGPWAPQLRRSSVRLRLTKGVHLVIDRERLPIPDAVVMAEGRRILFAIPWAQRVILGATDTDYDGVIEEVRTEPADRRYILDVVNATFPDVRLTESDVISDWAGLRPLIADAHGGPSDISRAHEIREPSPGWFDVIGGKLTTYRLMAEQTVNRIVRRLGQPVVSAVEQPVVSGVERPVVSAVERPVVSAVERCLTAEVPLLTPDDTAGISAIVPPEPSRALIVHFCRNEWAVHLHDIMVRRTSWHYYFIDAAQIAERIAVWMGEILGWDARVRTDELERWGALRRK